MDIERINEIAYESMAHRKTHEAREPGFIFYHGRRTAHIALKLSHRINAKVNHDILYTGALFHDIGKGTEPHNEAGVCIVRKLLKEVCLSSELGGICEIILKHNKRNHPNEYGLKTKIVQDADILDHVGPIVPWLAFYWSATHAETIDDSLRYFHGEENSRHQDRMRNSLNFEISVEIFDQRINFERKFFAELERAHKEGF